MPLLFALFFLAFFIDEFWELSEVDEFNKFDEFDELLENSFPINLRTTNNKIATKKCFMVMKVTRSYG